MRNLQIDYRGTDLNFQSASLLALNAAREERMQDPTIMAWHQSSDQDTPPVYDGADADTWWAKYGSGNGGRLEICVGEDYQFIMMDARGYEKLGDIPLRNLSDSKGNEYLCHTSTPGALADPLGSKSCAPLDSWAADQY